MDFIEQKDVKCNGFNCPILIRQKLTDKVSATSNKTQREIQSFVHVYSNSYRCLYRIDYSSKPPFGHKELYEKLVDIFHQESF